MHVQVLPQAWWEIEIRSQNEWKLSVSREKTHVLHQIGVDNAAETERALEVSCKQQNLPNRDTCDFPANRGLGQRTPVSSVFMDMGLETERVRTSASIPALVPLFAVLIAACASP